MLYKLTDKNDQTHNYMQWGVNVTHELPLKDNPQLCSDQVIHAYRNINLAILLNPIHAGYIPFNIWEANGKVEVEDYGKVGCFQLETITKLNIPDWYIDEEKRRTVQVQFAVLCAEAALDKFEEEYPDDDRPRKATEAAKALLKTKKITNDAYDAAYYDAAYATAYAAHAAAYDAADTAYDAHAAANAAYAAADAACAAYDAADAAAYAAYDAADAAHVNIDFGKLADEAVNSVLDR
jgi:hypothetical protein